MVSSKSTVSSYSLGEATKKKGGGFFLGPFFLGGPLAGVFKHI